MKKGKQSDKDDDYYDENADDDAASERGNTGDGKGDNKVSNVLTCLTALYLCTQMCHTALCYTTMCHFTLSVVSLPMFRCPRPCHSLSQSYLMSPTVSKIYMTGSRIQETLFFGQKGETVTVRRWEEEPS